MVITKIIQSTILGRVVHEIIIIGRAMLFVCTTYSPANSGEGFLAGHAFFGFLVRYPAMHDGTAHVLRSTRHPPNLFIEQRVHLDRARPVHGSGVKQ